MTIETARNRLRRAKAHRTFLAAATLLLACYVPQAQATMTITGSINSNTTWRLQDSPFYVPGNVSVLTGATLVIEPGVIVKFGQSFNNGISVQGTLWAQGTADNPIIFTDYRDDTAGGDTNGNGNASAPDVGGWGSISIPDKGVAFLDHCDIRYGGFQLGAVYKAGTGALTVTNSMFSSSYYEALNITGSTDPITVSGNTITASGFYGVRGVVLTNTGSNVTISGNTIQGFSTEGVLIQNSSPHINGNTITGGQYGLNLTNGSAPTLDAFNTITGNSVGQMAFDAPSSGAAANYDEVLTGPVVITGGTISSPNVITWSSNRNYILNSSVTINSGATLNIPAGKIFKLANGVWLNVNGALNAAGTTESPIYFTDSRDDSIGGDSNKDGTASSPSAGGWGSINITDNGTAFIDHCVVRYGGFQSGALVKTGAGTVTVSNSTISDYYYYAITINNSTTDTVTISGNTITGVGYYGQYGLKLNNAGSNVTVSGNTLQGFTWYGIQIQGGSPHINGNTITGGVYGIYLTGQGIPVLDAANVITGYSSGQMAMDAPSSGAAAGFDAALTDPIHIVGGEIASPNAITWSSNRVYYLTQSITVKSGATLNIAAGKTVKAGSNISIIVNGTLNATGTAQSPVSFTDYRDDSIGGDSNKDGAASSPTQGGWGRIYVDVNGTANLDHCVIKYGGFPSGAVYKTGAGSLTVSNSAFTNFYYYGIYLSGATGTVNLSGNTITGGGSYGYSGIYVVNSGNNVSITGNTLQSGNDHGLYLNNSSPQVNGNTFSGNAKYGIYVTTGSVPVLDAGNAFTGNTRGGMGYDPQSSVTATNYDVIMTEPVHVEGGTISSATVSWTSPRLYFVHGTITVNSGATLNVPAGKILKFAVQQGLSISGTLNASGTAGSKIYFTDSRDDSVGGDTNGDGTASSPSAGGWGSIYISAGGTATLDNCIIRYGGYNAGAVYKTGAGNLSVTNSTINNFYYYGIALSGTTNTITLTGNTITGGGSYGYTGINLQNAGGTVTISSNTIQGNTNYGIFANGAASTPSITRNKIVSNNIGVYAISSANPLIGGSAGSGNNLLNNTAYSVQNDTAAVTLNARNNYWGSAAGPYQATTNTGGNVNSKVSAYVDYGTWSPPPSGSILINGGAQLTSNTGVVLSLSCGETSSCVQMQFSNDDSTYTGLQPYGASASWVMNEGDGLKHVYVKYQYGTGDWSPSYSADITLDTTPPNAPSVTGTSPTNNQKPTWSWTTGGGGNGFRYQMGGETGAWTTTSSSSYTPTDNLAYGSYTLYVQESDTAGNWSASGSKTIDIVTTHPLLSVAINGYGRVTGTSTMLQDFLCPSGICPANYSIDDQVTLSATPATDFTFAGWSGDCTAASGTCILTMTDARNVTATFTTTKPALLLSGDSQSAYPSLIAAYGAALDNSTVTIQGQAVTFSGGLVLNRNVTVTLQGGYDTSFNSITGFSTIQGTVTVGKGSLVVEELAIQ